MPPHNRALTSLLGRAARALLERLGSDLAPLAVPAWHALGVVAAAVAVLVIGVRLRPRPARAEPGRRCRLRPAIRSWYARRGLVLIAAAAPARAGVPPGGGPADTGQLVLRQPAPRYGIGWRPWRVCSRRSFRPGAALPTRDNWCWKSVVACRP